MFSWFRRTPAPDPLILHLIDALQRQQDTQQKLLERVLDQSREQAATSQQMLESVLDMWKPRREPTASSMEDRALAKELEQNAWEPIPVNIFEQLDADIGIPQEFLK